MRISKLDHLVLVTSDLSRCVSFYRDLLHMEVEEKDGRFALRFGTSKINIHTCPGEFQPAAERPVPGSLDICFMPRNMHWRRSFCFSARGSGGRLISGDR